MNHTTSILHIEDLQAITGYQKRSSIERLLRQQNIKFFYSRYGVWTTIELVNKAGCIYDDEIEGYDSEII